MEQSLAAMGDSPSSIIPGNVLTLNNLPSGTKTRLTEADVTQKIQQTLEKRFGSSDREQQRVQRDEDLDQLVVNNFQNDLSGASTWHGPLRGDPWLR